MGQFNLSSYFVPVRRDINLLVTNASRVHHVSMNRVFGLRFIFDNFHRLALYMINQRKGYMQIFAHLANREDLQDLARVFGSGVCIGHLCCLKFSIWLIWPSIVQLIVAGRLFPSAVGNEKRKEEETRLRRVTVLLRPAAQALRLQLDYVPLSLEGQLATNAQFRLHHIFLVRYQSDSTLKQYTVSN